LKCLISGTSHDGQGVGRLNSRVVFIPGALPGEEVDIEIIAEKNRYARGRLNSIIKPSDKRINPPCSYYGFCGGCVYQHASYELQLELKVIVVEQTLERIGKMNAEVSPCIPSPKPWRYRNKAVWHAANHGQGWLMGYYQPEDKQILGIDDCLLISEKMQLLSRSVKNALNNLPENVSPLEITIRESSWNKHLMLIISGSNLSSHREWLEDAGSEAESICTVYNNKIFNIKGKTYMEEKLLDVRYDFSPLAFFQVNHGQAENLIRIVRDLLDLKGGEHILDAYCGVGTLALNLARDAKKVMGIESFPSAVEDAIHNARLNNLQNCRFLAGKSEDVMPTLSQRFDVCILDPPRSGCHPKVIKTIAIQKIPRVIYVSCEPSTLARDLAAFNQSGYRVLKVQPLDMFPQTRHVECVTLMSRVKK